MEKTDAKERNTEKKKGPAIVTIRVRGDVNLGSPIRQTLTFLKLRKKNTCVVYPDTPGIRGMLNHVKDYTTWGTLTEETHQALIQKRKTATENVFFLAPPRKGYGRKGIKKSFSVGGALGDRKEKINELIQRMM